MLRMFEGFLKDLCSVHASVPDAYAHVGIKARANAQVYKKM
jgi:hypothetical protein